MSQQRRFSILFLVPLLLILASRPALCAEGESLLQRVPLFDAGGALLPPGLICAPYASIRHEPITQAAFPLDRIAEAFPCLYQQATFGDTDHDGRNEVIVYVNDNFTYHYRILEAQGNNVYADEYSGDPLLPYAVGDLDADGKSEIIGQQGSYVYVYESSDASTYPTNLVWTSPAMSNIVGFTAIGDTDRDGKAEIIHSMNLLGGSSELFIYENTGDNSFAEVYHTIVEPGAASGEKVIGDFDGDGLTEIAFSGVSGDISVYESSADNTWSRTWTDSTGMSNAYGAEGGVDTDGNGKPELFIAGNSALGWTTRIYEATGDNQFALVDSLAMADGYIGSSCNALADLDGSGKRKYLMQGAKHFWIYAPGSPGHWNLVDVYQNPTGDNHFGLQTFDLNKNGVAEIFYDLEVSIQSGLKSWILEHPRGPAGVGAPPEAGASRLQVWPNPCVSGVSWNVAADRLSIDQLDLYDLSGRRISSLRPGTSRPIHWDPGYLGTGIYLLKAVDERGATSATARVAVIR
ncbi:MAG: T9SS type A sorting domain-containing protein [Candidatus Eisenbacteria bacterium]|uniref:T9SS type A sorting domain-containing protein n=1 Tax=Eiseniibacteriota bacterium TaxID=2212470 RepID=A0A849SSA7_UNCEI|nr:T9SS type A sorting domain-containing protein [Candidatus Eisenbacteria bacterium]